MFVCLPDVQDQISSYPVVIACLFCSSDGILVMIEHLSLNQLGDITLGNGGLDPVHEPHLNLPPCLPYILPGILTYCGQIL